MPNGLPQAGDHGVDNTHTWGRTYWGGALFCLLADLEIRRSTQNRLGLQDALRAILAAGNMESESTLEPLLAIGDRAVGVPALAELYRRMNKPAPTDLSRCGSSWGSYARRRGTLRRGRSGQHSSRDHHGARFRS
jgi:predicted metalloprotease with PDZ domain